MKFILHVPEVHVHRIAVEANDLDEAISKIDEGNANLEDLVAVEYSHTLDPAEWKVELESGDTVSIEEYRKQQN